MKKRILALFTMGLVIIFFTNCSKDGEVTRTVKNLSGYDWYETTVCSTNEEGVIIRAKYKENILIGEDAYIYTTATHFYISAKDYKGRNLKSENIKFEGSSTIVSSSHLLYPLPEIKQ